MPLPGFAVKNSQPAKPQLIAIKNIIWINARKEQLQRSQKNHPALKEAYSTGKSL